MEIKEVVIDDICKFIGGSQPAKMFFKNEAKDGYVRLIQTRDYKTDKYITYIPNELAKKKCNANDIMIGRYGPPIFQILRGLEGAYNVALMKAVPKDNVLNEYLFYFLKQDAIFKYVDKLSPRTGGQTGVDLIALRQYPVLLPHLRYQKKVAGVLKSLDDKIKLNNKIKANLEKIVTVLYNYWFVQFDFPDANGKPYKFSGGAMVYNEVLKREIPDGWGDTKLETIGNVIGGSTPSKKEEAYFTNNGMAWITPKDLSLNRGNKYISKGLLDVSEKGIKAASLKIMPKGTVLLSSRAPIGYMAIAREEVTTNQGFKSLVPKEGYSTEYIYYTVKNLIKEIEHKSSGSTFKEISGSVLKSINIVLPPKDLIAKYNETACSIFERQNLLEIENQKLAELRDWLLPMLMNGQVRVQ